MNIVKVSEVFNASKEAQNVLKFFNTRQRTRKEMNLKYVRREMQVLQLVVSRDNLIKVFRDMESVGLGHLEVAKSRKAVWHWAYSIKEVCAAMRADVSYPTHAARIHMSDVVSGGAKLTIKRNGTEITTEFELSPGNLEKIATFVTKLSN